MLFSFLADDPDPDPPVYREGYPAFDLAEATQRRKMNRVSVTWRNQLNHAIGSGSPEWIGDFKIIIGYQINLVRYLDGGIVTLVLPINWISRGSFLKASVDCRSCGLSVTRLYLAGVDWLCAKCQGLGHRRNVMSKPAARSERLSELRAEVGLGRPPGMSDRAFLEKQRMIRELERQVGTTLVRAGPRHRALITADWYPNPPMEKAAEKTPPRRDLVKPGFSDLP